MGLFAEESWWVQLFSPTAEYERSQEKFTFQLMVRNFWLPLLVVTVITSPLPAEGSLSVHTWHRNVSPHASRVTTLAALGHLCASRLAHVLLQVFQPAAWINAHSELYVHEVRQLILDLDGRVSLSEIPIFNEDISAVCIGLTAELSKLPQATN